MKKEDLIKEVARLNDRNENWAREDKRVRTELSKILRYQNWDSGIGSYSRQEEPMTWIQIAFAMGELRADANYAMIIEQVRNKDMEIAALKNPPNQLNN